MEILEDHNMNDLDILITIWPELTPYKNNIYLIYAGPNGNLPFDRQSTVDIINEINQAKQRGHTKIVFYNFSESMITPSILKAQEIVDTIDYNCNNFFYVTAAIDGQRAYNKLVEENHWSNTMIIMSCDSFEFHIKNTYNSLLSRGLIIDEYKIGSRDKKFLCLNRMHRESRLELLSEIIKSDLLKDSYYSFGGVDNSWLDSIDQYNISDQAKQCIKDNLSILPLRLNITEERPNPAELMEQDITYYANSYFSLIPETAYYINRKHLTLTMENSRYITEKIYKSILLKHPFILVGYPETLKFLRSRGYKTFSPYIDESYDQEYHDEHRLTMIVSEVKKLCQMTDSEWISWQTNIKDIVEHNHNNLLSRSDHRITTSVEKLFGADQIGL